MFCQHLLTLMQAKYGKCMLSSACCGFEVTVCSPLPIALIVSAQTLLVMSSLSTSGKVLLRAPTDNEEDADGSGT